MVPLRYVLPDAPKPYPSRGRTERQDVDIWEEPEEGNVLREPSADGWETSIRAGTLNKLVEKLTAEQTPGAENLSSPRAFDCWLMDSLSQTWYM